MNTGNKVVNGYYFDKTIRFVHGKGFSVGSKHAFMGLIVYAFACQFLFGFAAPSHFRERKDASRNQIETNVVWFSQNVI